MKELIERSNFVLTTPLRLMFSAFIAIGLLMFVIGLAAGDPTRTWQAFHINTVFWGGLSIAGVMLSVIWQITDARWGRPFKRLSEGFGAFLPIAFLAYIMVFFGASYLFEWTHSPMHVKEGYLNMPFFVVRTLLGLGLLFGLTMYYILNTIKPDLSLARQWFGNQAGGRFADWALKDYGTHEEEVVNREVKSRRLAPLLAFVYALVMSLIAVDYIMSLDQEWFSTLFGVFSFIGNLYSALALLLIIIAFRRDAEGLSEYMTINRFHDLTKFTFAIAMVWTYMVFTQYLVIWYSNLPEEAPYLIIRSLPGTPWYPLFWALFAVLFVTPFLALMSRTICRKPKVVAVIALILLVGQWWANYLLVVPSVQGSHGEHHFVFGITEILVTLGFTGAFLLSFYSFMSKIPVLPISDKHLCKTWHGR